MKLTEHKTSKQPSGSGLPLLYENDTKKKIRNAEVKISKKVHPRDQNMH